MPRILLHDYSGHPFQVQLARELARRGHRVDHVYSSGIQTPRGALETRSGDPAGLTIHPLSIGEQLDKYRFVRRWRQERRYASRLAAYIRQRQPEIVFSGNAPPDIQTAALEGARAVGGRFIFWLQDLYGEAAARLLRRRMPAIGPVAAKWIGRTEWLCLRRSDAIVAITDDFRTVLRKQGIGDDRIVTIENWSPLDEIAPRAKENPWSERFDVARKFCFLYAGTLGLKHNPAVLAALAQSFADTPDVRVIVASEGPGADYLKAAKQERNLANLMLLPFQPYEELPDMLGAADVLLALLEPEAGKFSVPSKVLTYVAAGRPVLAAMPAENLSARIVARERAGRVVPPQDTEAFVAAAHRLAQGEALAEMGARGRAYAERAFAIGPITDRFEGLIDRIVSDKRVRS